MSKKIRCAKKINAFSRCFILVLREEEYFLFIMKVLLSSDKVINISS